MAMKKLNDCDLDQVVGGTITEDMELVKLGGRSGSDIDYLASKAYGVSIDQVYIKRNNSMATGDKPNVYKISGKDVSHADFVAKCNEYLISHDM